MVVSKDIDSLKLSGSVSNISPEKCCSTKKKKKQAVCLAKETSTQYDHKNQSFLQPYDCGFSETCVWLWKGGCCMKAQGHFLKCLGLRYYCAMVIPAEYIE